MRKITNILLSLTLLLGVGVISFINTNKEAKVGHAIENPAVLANEELDTSNAFYDDFSNGFDTNVWAIGKRKWGKENSGVRPENVFYDQENKNMIFRALGDQYKDNEFYNDNSDAMYTDGRRSGGAIIRKEYSGPGRYEVRMKLAPFTGVCSAFWTMNGDSKSEIDFELPGRVVRNGDGYFSFNEVICTTWTSPNEANDMTSQIINAPYYLNDNQFHNYTFDWYYSNNNKVVIWYLDGVELCRSYTNVSGFNARIWVGCWLPCNQYFIGIPNFDKAYMDVDYVSYIPFKNQIHEEYYEDLVGVTNQFQLKTLNSRNFIANEGFNANSLEAFNTNGTVNISSSYDVNNNPSSYGVKLSKNASLSYSISNVEGLNKLDLSFKYKNTGSMNITYYGENGLLNTEFSSGTLTNSPSEYKEYTSTVNIPSDARRAIITFTSEANDGIYLDDLFLGYKGEEEVVDPSDDSYGFTLKESNQSASLGTISVHPDGNNSKNWKISLGNYYKHPSRPLILYLRAYGSGDIMTRSADSTCFDEIATALINASAVGERDNSDYHHVTCMYQEFDMTYFNDISVSFNYMSLKKGWERISVLYSINKGSSWSLLKQVFAKDINNTGDGYYNFDVKASIVINNKKHFKDNLDNHAGICNASDVFKEFLQREYNNLTAGEITSLGTEMMKYYPNQSYISGYNYLLNYWGISPLPTSTLIKADNKVSALMAIFISASLIGIGLAVFIARKKHN